MIYHQIDILYYACGGGMGHANRCAAILRKFKNKKILAVTSTPYVTPIFNEKIPYINLYGLNAESVRNHLRWIILNYNPRIIIMDTFPHGVAGEMEEIIKESRSKTILITRHIKQELATKWQDIARKFDMIINVEKPMQYQSSILEVTEPVLLRDSNELPSRSESRMLLSVYDDLPVIAAVSSGSFEWEANLFSSFLNIWNNSERMFHPRLFSPYIQEYANKPLIELLPGIDAVIGAAGYNLFHEIKATKTTGIFLPQPKRYDDQFWRARNYTTPDSHDNLKQIIYDSCLITKKDEIIKYKNGAEKVVEIISKFI